MSTMQLSWPRIKQIAAAVPRQVIPIADKRFTKVVGVKEKRVAPQEMRASDLGIAAARTLDLSDVGLIIFCSQTHDRFVPFSSNKIQAALNLPKTTGTMDINSGCTGFILGLQTAFAIAQFTTYDVLLIVGDTLSRTTGAHDPASSQIFGDAAAACVIGGMSEGAIFSLYSCGELGDAIRITGGFDGGGDPLLYMDGDTVLEFALREVPQAVDTMLRVCRPDNFVFHQSNKMILDSFRHYSRLPLPTSLELFGNTSGASIPLTIVMNKIQGKTLMCGYGSGLTWGCCYTDLDCEIMPLVEL